MLVKKLNHKGNKKFMKEKYQLNSVSEMFRWKLTPRELVNEEPIAYPSVEWANRDLVNKLKWEELDVLYSFTLIYYLGLMVVNNKRFEELFEKEKYEQQNNRLCCYSTRFLYKCSTDRDFKEYNEASELKDFIQVYFSIGNVIPIWPGGNELKGKMGIFDIPEWFFKKYPKWTKALIELYPNAFLKPVIENNSFFISNDQMYAISGYENSFNDLNSFIKCVKNKLHNDDCKNFYFDYLKRRTVIIKQRENEIINYLNNKN